MSLPHFASSGRLSADTARPWRLRPLFFLLLAVFPFAARAQNTIAIRPGNGGRTMAPIGSQFSVPIIADMTNAGGTSLSSLVLNVSWDHNTIQYFSISSAGAGSVTFSNVDGQSNGVTLTFTSPVPVTTTQTIASMVFTTGTGGTRLRITPVDATDPNGNSRLASIRVRDLGVCVGAGLWGDVTGDATVNIIDAQQIARRSVGLSVLNTQMVDAHGDVTADGAVNIIDAQQIARHSVLLNAAARINTAVTPSVPASAITINARREAIGGAYDPASTLSAAAIMKGTAMQLDVTARDANQNDITPCAALAFSTTNGGVATISSDGLVFTHAAGTASVAVTSGQVSSSNALTVVDASLAITTQPSGAVSGHLLSTPPVVSIVDAQGNPLSNANNTIVAEVVSGNASVVSGGSVTAVNGVATFSNLMLAGSGSSTLRFSTAALPSVNAAPVSVAQVASALRVVQLTPSAATGVPLAVQPAVEVLDEAGVRVDGNAATITAQITGGGGTLSGTTTVSAVNGLATFNDLSITGSGTQTISFTSPSLVPAPGTITVYQSMGVPVALQLPTPPPGNVAEGTPFTAIVEIRDAANTRVSGATNLVTVAISGSGTLNGTTSVAAVNGVATFSDLSIIGPASGYTLTFSSSGLTPIASLSVSVFQRISLLFATQASGSVLDGQPLTVQPVVELRNTANQLMTALTGTVTATLEGAGTLAGVTTVGVASGTATFTNLAITGAGLRRLRFSAAVSGTSVQTATSGDIIVSAAAHHLAVATPPSAATSGAPISVAPVISILDAESFPVGAASNIVTATLASGTGTLSGTTSVAAVAGTATFPNLVITGSGPHALQFTASGLGSVTTPTFSVTGSDNTLALVTQPSANATRGAPFPVQPVVSIHDASNLTNASASNVITANIASGSGTLGGTTSITAVNGIATFSNLWIDGSGTHTLRFTSPGLPDVVSGSIGVASAASALVVMTPPSSIVMSGGPFTTQPVVRIADASNATVTTATNAVTATITSGAGTVGGTTTVNAVNGIVAFDDLMITGEGPHTVTFSAAGVASASAQVYVERFVSVTTGLMTSCAMTVRGSVYCRALNDSNSVRVQGSLKFAAFATGHMDARCGLTQSGAAYCWNVPDFSTLATMYAPSPVAPALRFSQLAVNDKAMCGITLGAAALHCWTEGSSTTTQIMPGTTFAEVEVSNHSCALTTANDLYCWGNNDLGQLGPGGPQQEWGVPVPSTTPWKVNTPFTVSSFTLGSFSTCALTTSGDAYCWGRGGGRLGSGTDESVSGGQILAVAGGLTYTRLSFGASHVCTIATGQTGYCWGGDDLARGYVGNGDRYQVYPVPTPIAGAFHWADVSAGFYESSGATTAGTVYFWGLPYPYHDIYRMRLPP